MRQSRDQTLMTVAHVYAERSTCTRNAVGAVISLEGRIIATGYNGTPAGMPHCNHTCPCEQGFQQAPEYGVLPLHTDQCPMKPCRQAVHAEANAIAFAAKHGVGTNGATLYTTLSPCYACSQLIINAGIARVVYSHLYRDTSGLTLLHDAGVKRSQT